MADVFLSYAKEDRTAAEGLATALLRQGWSVWWDENILPGRDFDEVIEQQLTSAASVIVLWSESARRSKYVRGEAREAQSLGKLIPVFIEDVKPPIDLHSIEGALLYDWDGSENFPEFEKLLAAIRRTASREPGPDAGQDRGDSAPKASPAQQKRANGAVRRFQTLLVLIVTATVISSVAAVTGDRTSADLGVVESLFSASIVLTATDRSFVISNVNGEPADDWRQRAAASSPIGVLPTRGPLVEVLRLWDIPDSIVEGSIAISNGETLRFRRHPQSDASISTETCPQSASDDCFVYSITDSGRNLASVTVYRSDDGEWLYAPAGDVPPMLRTEIDSSIVQLAARSISSPDNAEAAYLGLRDMAAQRTVRIPVLDVDVDASIAGYVLAVFSLVVAALVAHSLLIIRTTAGLDLTEPWIVIPAARAQKRWMAALQIVLNQCSRVIVLMLTLLPIAVAWSSIRITDVTSSVLLWGLLCCTSVLAVGSMVMLASILRSNPSKAMIGN